MALNPQQEQFCLEYALCFSAKKAAERAGYSKHSATTTGWQLLRNPEVKARVEELLAERWMGPNEALNRVGEMARAEHTDYFLEDGSFDIGALIRDGKGYLIKAVRETPQGRQYEFHDSSALLDKLLRVHGLFDDRLALSGRLDVKQYVTISPDDWDADGGELNE